MRRALVAFAALSACAPDVAEIGVSSTALRPDHPRSQELFRFDPGDAVEHHDSPGGAFRVHFARAGRHAVPAADTDGSGVPDSVERLAVLYDALLVVYRAQGWREPISDGALPDNGGDARFDVYLIDFARAADGSFRAERCTGQTCSGFMVQENDFVGYGYPSVVIAERVVASHELFHAIQAAYDHDQGSVLAEGTAVWASEQFDASLSDLEGQIRGYLENSGRSLDVPLPGPVDPFSYGSALVFQFLSERFDPAIVREIYEGVAAQEAAWKDVLAEAIVRRGSTFADAFVELASWNLYTGAFASAGYGYAGAARYPRVRAQAVTAPVREEALRVFYASAPVFSVTTGGRDPIEVAISGADLKGLSLIAAPISGGRAVAPPLTGAQRIAISGAEGVLVAIVNANLSGNSKRPTLCAGTTAEVDACLGVAPAQDAGVAAEDASEPMLDAGADPDAGLAADAAPAVIAPPVEEPSSCATSTGRADLALALVLIAALAARRGRRPHA